MILWLTSKSGYSPAIRGVLATALQRNAGIPLNKILFNSLYFKTPSLAEHDKNKMPNEWAVKQALKNLDGDISILQPKLIVINDEDTLRAITGEKYTLNTTRGSLYFYKGTPCLVIDDFKTIRWKKYGKFVFELDLAKIARWAKGEQKNEPTFSLNICETVDEVALNCEAAEASTMVATDTETAGGFITCVSYTFDDRDGKLRTFVVPFYDPYKEEGAYWKTEKEEIAVRKRLKQLMASPVVKTMQNGTYDCAYFIKEGMPPVNFLVDTQNLMHSIWCEAPKALHNIASYFVDHYTYWKDENKGAKEDGFGRNHDGLKRYWRYNGLDSYYTWLGASELLSRIRLLPWAVRNYSSEFGLSVGPCLAGSLRGIKVERNRHATIMLEQKKLADRGELDLKNLSNEKDFNVNSPYDNAWLLYDVLGAQVTRLQRKGSKYGKRSTDEKVLKLMKEQLNFFVSNAIDRILKAKKPMAVLSKYGEMWKLCYKNDRFLSWHNAAGTETFRFNSGGSQFWTGTNAQNLQPFIQEMFVADPDYVFVDCDYSASDDWFIAYEAQDEVKMEVLRTKDTHSFHAATFFKLDYDKVVKGKKNHEPWVVDAILGVRQIAKKFNHGKNFRMGATMTYNLMGRDMAVATAKAIGYARAEGMTDKELIGMCETIGDLYDHKQRGMYKRIKPWQDETVEELKTNKGLAVNAFGITRNFFGDPDDHAVQRELSAFYGQSGTSGNINRALRRIFYSGVDDGKTCLFLIQVHDSLKFLVHKDHLHSKVQQIKSIMEEKLSLKGREFFVPVSVEVGLTDGKRMLPYSPDLTYEQLVAHEEATYGNKFPKGNEALLKQLGEMSFDADGLSALDEELGEKFGISQDETSQNEDDPELVEESEE